VLVDTQGHLLAVKVTGAHRSDQHGAKVMLKPLKESFPRMKLLWGDSHYGGTFIGWLRWNVGWTMQTVRALKVPKRGLLVPEGTEVDWDALFPPGCASAAQEMGGRANLRLDCALASPLSRS
jgi:hypothetical protein